MILKQFCRQFLSRNIWWWEISLGKNEEVTKVNTFLLKSLIFPRANFPPPKNREKITIKLVLESISKWFARKETLPFQRISFLFFWFDLENIGKNRNLWSEWVPNQVLGGTGGVGCPFQCRCIYDIYIYIYDGVWSILTSLHPPPPVTRWGIPTQ